MGNSRTDTITIAYRFAPQAAVTRQWDLQRSHKDAYMPMSDVQAFTQEALTAETVLLRVTDVDGDSITASFKLDGLAEALKTLPCANATPLVSKR
jgi:hypothetical protein